MKNRLTTLELDYLLDRFQVEELTKADVWDLVHTLVYIYHDESEEAEYRYAAEVLLMMLHLY